MNGYTSGASRSWGLVETPPHHEPTDEERRARLVADYEAAVQAGDCEAADRLETLLNDGEA